MDHHGPLVFHPGFHFGYVLTHAHLRIPFKAASLIPAETICAPGRWRANVSRGFPDRTLLCWGGGAGEARSPLIPQTASGFLWDALRCFFSGTEQDGSYFESGSSYLSPKTARLLVLVQWRYSQVLLAMGAVTEASLA